jgi:ATP-binding cassette subfamily C protein
MTDRVAVAGKDGDPLVAACRLVAEASGISVRVAAVSSEQGRDRLGQIARTSRFRTRRVALRGQWWKSDAGPLLGLLVSEDGETRLPVALLPERSGHYSLVNPSTSVRIDAALNERLNPFAYAFYRPFADQALKAFDVFKFGASRCSGDFLMILLMGLAGGVLGLLAPIITGEIFNRVIPGAERLQLGHMVAALLVCAVATSMFQLVRGLAVLRVESKMDASVQSAVWDRLLNLPTSFFRQFDAGDLAVRAGGISAIRQLLSGATVSSLLSGLFSALNLALLFYYDAGLALWALALTLLALAVMLGTTFVQLRYQREVAARQSRLSGTVLQYITGITKLRVAGAETKSYERWAHLFTEQRRLQFRARRIGNMLTTFSAVFPLLSMMVIFGLMASRENGLMSTGDFIAFNGAFGTFTANMLAMTGAFVSILIAIPIYEQARPILEALPEIDDSKSDPGDLSGAIEIEHVSFRYDPDGPQILQDVSLRARAGEFVAFVGPSGSGKSTVLRLLLGFETPESGSIYFDGQDLSGLDVQSVRRQIGVVLQNGGLMSGDLFTNITGSSPATMDDAWEAARMAGLDEDVRQMPMGMHTIVSEGGTTLSGGQRQRLLIARAVVNRPRILFFDEATSALDNRTQAIVSESLGKLQATRIVVAHRLSTIINADRIYVLDQGRVVQEGKYESLLADGGLFADLVRRQVA